jgi:uncharacterized protein
VTPVRWLPWTTDAFSRARKEDKPVLLSIVAPWCASSHEMDRGTYADASVADLVNERFVAIRIDADRRPDISERYSLGGWPTTAFLTADGHVITGGTFIPLDRMDGVLRKVLEAFRSRRGELEPRAPAAEGDASTLDTIHAAGPSPDLRLVVFDSFDADHGGFGTAPKFPIAAPLELALDTYRASRDPHLARIVETTLDAMGWGGLYDDVDGGFFRCAARRDWQAPSREKLLDINASLLRLYLDASETLEIARYRERAADVLRYVQTWLADAVDGGWAGSQQADGAYYELPVEGRRTRTPPRVDTVFYAGRNASMAASALRASLLFDDTGLGEFALKSLERVLIGCYTPGAGVAHCLERRPSVRGLLDDQIAMASAQLDAYAATGNIVYEMMAQELLHFALRTMWDEAEGGFFDRSVPDERERIGRMNDRLKPFVGNCEAARVLRRLAEVTGNREFGDKADETLAAMAPLAQDHGPLAAHYLLALGAPHSK